MITIGGENLIDFVQTDTLGGLPVYKAIPGGSCYNVAIAAARQGGSVGYVTPVSNDTLGNVITDRLSANAVKLCAPRVNAPTSCAVVSIIDNQASYQFYRHGTAERQITLSLLDEVIPKEATIFHIGSLALIEGFDAELWEDIFSKMASRGVFTSLDPNVRPDFVKDKEAYIDRLLRMMQHTDILKLSDKDLEYIIPDVSLKDAFDDLYKKTNASIVILTKGEKGATVRTAVNTFDIAAITVNSLVDTVGAGDTFMGTILAELEKCNLSGHQLKSLKTETLRQMVSQASKAAALNCETLGCNPPYRCDLKGI
ncbi:MAG: carbohydrate kinase [Rhodobacteraceae bacterium]|nr:carbohydrate kinase [Paracoccaceae bacterium]